VNDLQLLAWPVEPAALWTGTAAIYVCFADPNFAVLIKTTRSAAFGRRCDRRGRLRQHNLLAIMLETTP